MKRLTTTLALILCLFLCGFAQEGNDIQHQTYFYTVENVQSQEQLEQVVSSFEELKFVEKVKLNYKPEKAGKAQFIVYVSEPKRTSESQVMFELTDLKKIIISNGLQPAALEIENN
jgi:uncharacterized protein (DUF1919 family)